MPDSALRIFIIYAREDEAFRAELIGQLRPMEKAGQVRVWTDRDLIAGEYWDVVLKQQLRSADLILLLVSSDYFQSDYIHEVEIKEALERHREGLAKVVPVIVRPCDWESDPVISELQILPTDGAPVADTRHWHTREAAWVDVVRGVRRTAQQLREERAEAERKKQEETERIRQAEIAALAAQQEAERRQREALEQSRAEAAKQRQMEGQRRREADLAAEAQRAKEAAQAAERQRQAEREREQREQEIALREAEQAAWQQAVTAQDPSLYATYLAAYPNGIHAREARAALKKFRQAEKSGSRIVPPIWGRAFIAVTAIILFLLLAFVAYRFFSGDGPHKDDPTQTAPVQTPPAPAGAEPDGSVTIEPEEKKVPEGQSPEQKEAARQERLAIEDSKAWDKARTTQSADACQDYLNKYPKGRHTTQAQQCVKDYSDSDGDGVLNKNDECPTEKGTIKSKGCKENHLNLGRALVVGVKNITVKPLEMRPSGKEKTKSKAKSVDKLSICFTAVSNLLVSAGQETFHIRIIDPTGVGITGSPDSVTRNKDNNQDFAYATIAICDYSKVEAKVCGGWQPSLNYVKGKYSVEVYNKGYLVGTGEFALK